MERYLAEGVGGRSKYFKAGEFAVGAGLLLLALVFKSFYFTVFGVFFAVHGLMDKYVEVNEEGIVTQYVLGHFKQRKDVWRWKDIAVIAKEEAIASAESASGKEEQKKEAPLCALRFTRLNLRSKTLYFKPEEAASVLALALRINPSIARE